VNNETAKMQKEETVDYGSVKVTGLQKSLPCSNSGSLIIYPLSFDVAFRTPNRRLLGDYLKYARKLH
jgi:hypothetical protein